MDSLEISSWFLIIYSLEIVILLFGIFAYLSLIGVLIKFDVFHINLRIILCNIFALLTLNTFLQLFRIWFVLMQNEYFNSNVKKKSKFFNKFRKKHKTALILIFYR